jgi:hypothetical protein
MSREVARRLTLAAPRRVNEARFVPVRRLKGDPFGSTIREARTRILVQDLPTDAIRRIEERMRPGGASHAGFLAVGESLSQVVQRDENTLARVGVTPEQLVSHLRTILEEARDRFLANGRKGPRGGIVVRDRYHVYGFDVVVLGHQECPFEDLSGKPCNGHTEDCYRYGAQDFAVVNSVNGLKFGFPVLALHLVGDHHFFEGSVEYRVDPLLAARALDLSSDST